MVVWYGGCGRQGRSSPSQLPHVDLKARGPSLTGGVDSTAPTAAALPGEWVQLHAAAEGARRTPSAPPHAVHPPLHDDINTRGPPVPRAAVVPLGGGGHVERSTGHGGWVMQVCWSTDGALRDP